MCGGGGPIPGPYIMKGGAPRDPLPRAEKVPAFLLPLGPWGGMGIIMGGPCPGPGAGPPLWGPPPFTGGRPLGALIPMKLPALIFRPPITDPDRPVAMSITDPLPRIPPVPFPMFPFIKGGFRSPPSIRSRDLDFFFFFFSFFSSLPSPLLANSSGMGGGGGDCIII